MYLFKRKQDLEKSYHLQKAFRQELLKTEELTIELDVETEKEVIFTYFKILKQNNFIFKMLNLIICNQNFRHFYTKKEINFLYTLNKG